MSTHTGACRSAVYHPRDDQIPRQARRWPPRLDTVKKIPVRTPDRAHLFQAATVDARGGSVRRPGSQRSGPLRPVGVCTTQRRTVP